jgi:hypothetical protein
MARRIPAELSYSNFWEKFRVLCRNHLPDVRTIPFVFGHVGQFVEMKLSSPIHLIGLSMRHSSIKRIEVLVDANETYSGSCKEIIKSSVRVNYFQVKPARRSLIESVHYDYDALTQAAHPVFHAQLGADLIANATSFDYTICSAPQLGRFGHMRIPTAHMNLSSVLISVIADHTSPSFFESFVSDMIAFDKQIPEASCSGLNDRITRSHSFKSRNWYQINSP